MRKQTVLLLAFLFIFGCTASAFAADSGSAYADVPPSHWAYKAVKQLAEAGIIDGYNNSTFAGDKPATRYEMAQMVFNALGNYEKANDSQKLLIDALKAEYEDIFQKVTDHEKRISKLEKEKSRLAFSGMLSVRYRDVNYDQTGKSSQILHQYRLRLDGKYTVDKNSSIGFRFVTRAPNKDDFFNDSWTNYGGDNNTDSGSQNQTIDRVYYTTKLGRSTGSLTVGRQALVVDPMNIIMDSTFYSYGGGKLSYRSKLFGGDAAITAQYGSFYKGATLSGFTGWGDKSATDFQNADISSLIVNGKANRFDYTVGYANFRNSQASKDLLTYTFGNIGFKLAPKIGLSFEAANNSADTDGTFWTSKIVYGDQALKKQGQWNVSLQYIDAEKNAIFNRFAMLEGAAGKNTNSPEKFWDARINYAISPNASFYVQRMLVDDTKAADDKNDLLLCKPNIEKKI